MKGVSIPHAVAEFAINDRARLLARIAEVEAAMGTVEEWDVAQRKVIQGLTDDLDTLRAELAAIKAQGPSIGILMGADGWNTSKLKTHGCTKPGCLPYCDCGGIDGAPVAKPHNAAKMPCGAVVSNVHEAYEAGLKVAKPVVMPVVWMVADETHDGITYMKLFSSESRAKKHAREKNRELNIKDYFKVIPLEVTQ